MLVNIQKPITMTKIQSKAFFISSQEKTYDLGKGLSRQFIAYDKDIMMVKVMFEKDAVGALHHHPHTQTSYIVSGKFEVTIDGKKQILSAGDGFYAGPNAEHACICLEAGAIIDVFNPIREDFYPSI